MRLIREFQEKTVRAVLQVLVPATRDRRSHETSGLIVARHSGAANCCITIGLDDALLIEIRDDGCGISQTSSNGLGLRSMSERAEELGGRFAFECDEGGGTILRALLPMTTT